MSNSLLFEAWGDRDRPFFISAFCFPSVAELGCFLFWGTVQTKAIATKIVSDMVCRETGIPS
ncbi:hypothetical protein [Geitlerinema sp. PCC 9228]|uniref:hypothetical protein n=1 Tax=Geitlerinema sp. PCC 9228 TaxID=111611 RepID=UPI0008F99F6F|nr:hypothetical protein [Geitlerinema sp. PCC 9228]